MTSFQKTVLALVLLSSALLVAVYSAMTPVGKSPDERHHFSYSYGIYEQGLTPFFDRSAIFTDGDDPNHLRHPPGYYFLLASVMAVLDIDKDYSKAGLSSAQFASSLKNAAIPPLRAVSLALYGIHLIGLFLLANLLVERKLISAWAAIAATALVLFIPSRMHIAGAVNNDALAIATWPFLALYATRMLLEPSLATLLKFGIACTVAALTKLTLAIVALPFAVVILAFQLLSFQPLRLKPQFGFWRQQLAAARWREAGLFGIFVVLFVFAAAYYGHTLLRYGSVNPTYTQIYGLSEDDNKFRAEAKDAKPWIEIANTVVTSSWQTTTGVFGHDHLYSDGNVTTELSLVAIALVSALAALLLALRYTERDPRRFAVPLLYLAVPTLFWTIWINWNVGNWATNGRLGTQGRYTIGALELGVIGIFVSWGLLSAAPSRNTKLIGGIGSMFAALLLTPVFFKPFLYARMEEHLYFGGKGPQLVVQNLESKGFTKLALKAAEPNSFVKSGYLELSRRSLHRQYFAMAPDGARVVAAIPRIDTGRYNAVEVAVWARPGARPTELQLSVRDVANSKEPTAQTLVFPDDIAVLTRCFPVSDQRMSIAIRRTDPEYSLWTKLFKNENPPFLLGAFAKPVEKCKQ